MNYDSALRDGRSEVVITKWEDGYHVTIEPEEIPCYFLDFFCRRILDRELFDMLC